MPKADSRIRSWCTNGLEAWKFLEIHHGSLCLVVTDLKMPSLSGIGLIRKMKTHSVLSIIPVIVQSTSDNPEEKEILRGLGIQHPIIKNIRYTEYIEAMARLLGAVFATDR